MSTLYKAIRPQLSFKADGEEGQFQATIATFNVVDHDRDVTLPGAFKTGQQIRIAQWGHNWSALPVGKGVLGQDEHRAWVDGQFFLDTPHGTDTYKTVKNLGDLQEWSYGFAILDSFMGEVDGEPVQYLRALDTFEACPVMLGAGINTGTDFIKTMKGRETFGKLLGYCEQHPEEIQALLTRIDEGKAAPFPIGDHGERVLLDLVDFTGRAKDLSELRAKEGRTLSAANRARLTRLLEQIASLNEISAEISQLLEDAEPAKQDTPETAAIVPAYLAFRRAHPHLFLEARIS